MYNTDLPTRAELPTTEKLLHSTIIAATTAMVLLITTVLPSEYGIDPTGAGRVLGLTEMGEIKVSLSREANQGATTAAAAGNMQGSSTPARLPVVAEVNTSSAAPQPATGQRHQMAITLSPGQAAEIKLSMIKGSKVAYEWRTNGPINVDAHGDPLNPAPGFYHGYGKAKQVTSDSGVLEAAFDGKHGWFWRNRSKSDITIRLTTNGDYQNIKRVL